jgi:DHA3 family macrolide efflux protein-like MFS transporter
MATGPDVSVAPIVAEPNPTTFKSYLFFWIGQQASLLGSSVAQFVLIWWITLETESAFYLALASLAGFAPMIIVTPFAGVLVDRWSRKTVIGVVDVLQALLTVVLIFLFWSGVVSVFHVLVLLALRSVCQAFHVPATNAIIPLMVPRDKLSRINGLNYLLSGAMTLLGPVMGAVLLVFWRVDQILWIDPGTLIIALIPLLIVTIPSVQGKQEQSSYKKDLVTGFAFIKNARGLPPLILLAVALNFLFTPLSTLLPYFVKFDHLGEATDLALVMAFAQLGTLIGGVFMTIRKEFKRKMVATAISLVISFTAYVVVSFTPIGSFWFMAIFIMIMSLGAAPANVSLITIIQTVVPVEMQGRINSVLGSLATAAMPLGMILSGILVTFTATTNLFLGCAIAGILILALSWFFTDMRHVEELEKKANNQKIQQES